MMISKLPNKEHISSDDILEQLKIHPESFINTYFRLAPFSSRRMEISLLSIPDPEGLEDQEILIFKESLDRIKNRLEVVNRWGDDYIGGLRWKLNSGE